MAFYPGVATSTVTIGTESVSYYDSAPGEGRPLLLLHGTSGSAESSFWALFPMLATRHRVVALDFIDPPEPTGGNSYVEQVLAVVQDASPDGPIDVLGYSFGAVIAATFAARHPLLMRSLVLVAGWLKTDQHQLLRNDLWWLLHETDHPALAPLTVFLNHSQRFLNSCPTRELARLTSAVANGSDRSAKMRFNRSVDISAEATRIEAPTLVVGCVEDQMVPLRHSELLFGAITDARLVRINTGHGVVSERPAELFALVDSFVERPDAIAAGSVLENSHA